MAIMADIKPHHVVLDAGCGVGGSSIYVSKKIGCHTIGITLSSKQVDLAKQNASKNGVENVTEFYEMDYTNTSFADNSFDIIWAIETICHCSNNDKFLIEAYRILKPGGKIIIADYFQTKKELTPAEHKKMNLNGFNGWLVNQIWKEDLLKEYSELIGFKNFSSLNVNEKVKPSAEKLIRKTKPLILFGWLYYKLGGLTNTEFHNALGTINICKTLGKLWDYKIIQISKPLK
jgi:cyclopropane fatty-acyl-phospholipid synthase-like methyltransferase